MYGSQGIQSQGRAIEVKSQIGSEQGKHGQSKIGKNCSWKYQSQCQNCETEFAGRKGAANRFCRNECQHEFSVKRWFDCSLCMAKVGIGSHRAGRLLGVSNTNVCRQWKRHGVKPRLSTPAGWQAKTPSVDRASTWKKYEDAWMGEIRSHAGFPDWSYVWKKEKARRSSADSYASMTEDTKRAKYLRFHHKRTHDPEFRKKKAEYQRQWNERNPEKRKSAMREWQKKRRKEDPGYRAQCNLRNRFKEIMGIVRDPSRRWNVGLVGCDTKQLARHLESKFKRGMTWENYGTYWHVDHIIPCAAFDHNKPGEVAQCWHWTNLQPLEAKANLAKSDNIEHGQLSLLLCVTH